MYRSAASFDVRTKLNFLKAALRERAVGSANIVAPDFNPAKKIT